MKFWITLSWLSIKVFALTATQFDDPNYSNLVKLDLKLLPDETKDEVEDMELYGKTALSLLKLNSFEVYTGDQLASLC